MANNQSNKPAGRNFLSGDTRGLGAAINGAQRAGDWSTYQKLTGDDGSNLPESKGQVVQFRIKKTRGQRPNPFVKAILEIENNWEAED